MPARAARSQETQTGTIRGKVTAPGGMPIGNAQVSVVGTVIGAVSARDGEYVIRNAPAGARTLRVRLIGYAPASAPVTVPAGGSATVNFELTVQATALDEVVVTGTAGAARKREVGNSIGTINLTTSPKVNSDFGAMIAGSLSGVQVAGGSGNAGAGKAIRLRGNTSVALSNQPLLYVDGVRVRSDEYPKNLPEAGSNLRSGNINASPLDDISPDDIERIEVVKGAAAATLYGTDAAAGVIQIFTKRGAQGAAKWQASVGTGFNKLQQFGTDDAKYLFMDPFLRTGKSMDAQAQVSGGTANNVRYFLSTGASSVEGVLPLDLDRKYTMRANMDFAPAKTLTVAWNSSYTNNIIQNTPAGNNAHGITLNAFRRDRNYFSNANPDTIRQVLRYKLNTYIDRAVLGMTGTWAPHPLFNSKMTIGLDRASVENRNLRPYGFYGAAQGIINDQRWVNRTVSVDWVNSLDQNYLDNAFHITFSFGTQYVNSEVADNSSYSENFPGPGQPTVSSGSLKNAFENRQMVITGGGFAQAMMGYKDRYFATLGMRVDGNSAFGENFGLQQYPKISGSWVASDESWWPSRFGATLKLRAALGQAGRAPGAFDAVQTWVPVGWGTQPAFRPSNLGNPDLGPERTTETEAGFDLTAFDNRVTMDFTAYRARTTDALFPVTSVPSLGFLNSQLKNVGTMEKHGIEMTVGGTVLDRENLGITAALSVTTNASEVISLGGAPAFQIGSTNAFAWVIEGQPVPVIRGRLIRNPNALVAAGAAPDTVGNHVFGPSAPTRIIGGTVTVRTWRGITASLRGEYQGGAYISENASFQALSRTVLWPTCFDAYDRIAAGQQITNKENAMCVQKNTREDMFIFKADFFKLRDLTLTVPLGKAIPGTTSSTLVFSAQNFFRRNYGMPMFDPEQSGNDGFNVAARYISEHIPAPAVFMTSLRVSF
jgi:TonB-dependent SusC/RagA subfamily outer membrane receptor